MISAYSLSFPLLSLHFLNITEASTLAGEKVLGSLSNEITLNRIVLEIEKKKGGGGSATNTHVYKIQKYCAFKFKTIIFETSGEKKQFCFVFSTQLVG